MGIRQFIDLVEDASADATKAKKAALAYRAFSDYATSRTAPDRTVDLGDGVYQGFEADRFGGDAVFGYDRLLILVGKRKNYAMEAMFGKMSGRGARFWQRVIVMYSAQEPGFASAISSIGTVEFLDVFTHEMVHCYDDAATGGKVISTHKYGHQPDVVKYFNNPWEFNAYYHMIISGWASFVDDCHGHDADYVRELGDLFDITGDFRTDMAQAISSQKRGRDFLKALTDPRRKALLRRLYQMHQQVRAVFAGTTDQAA